MVHSDLEYTECDGMSKEARALIPFHFMSCLSSLVVHEDFSGTATGWKLCLQEALLSGSLAHAESGPFDVQLSTDGPRYHCGP